METNEKLIAVVEIGGDKATQFWARADDLAQAYNEKSTDIVYSVKKPVSYTHLTKKCLESIYSAKTFFHYKPKFYEEGGRSFL